MSAPPGNAPPPSYTESLQTGQGGYQPSYGSTNAPFPPPVPYGHPQGAPYQPQGGAYPPPQGGAYPPPQGGAYPAQYAPVGYDKGYVPPSYQTHTTSSVVVQPAQTTVLVGGCPACRIGVLEDDFTCCGVLCAIMFFPLGVLCCIAMRQRRCGHCGAVFG